MSGDAQLDFGAATAVSPGRPRGGGELREVFEQTEYELLEEIGRGGMGRVYRAIHRKLKRPVAVKLLTDRRLDDSQAIARFLREMEIVGQLDHPHLVRAHDAGEIAGIHYLAMELVDGVDLHELVLAAGPLSVADACDLVRQAALGLQYASRRGLVHQDIKPSNLLLSRSGVVKVADLGLARLDTWRESADLLSTSDRIVGTFDFMAPEQAHGSQHVDIAADIYGLGCTLFFLLAGRAPFAHPSHDTPAKKLMAHAAEPPPALSEVRRDVPREVSQIVERSLSKRPQDRYPQPSDMAEALEPLAVGSNLAGLAASAMGAMGKPSDGAVPDADPFARTRSFHRVLPSTDPATTRVAPRQRDRRLAWLVGTAAAAVAVGVGVYASRPPAQSGTPSGGAVPAAIGDMPPGKEVSSAAAEWARVLSQAPKELFYPGRKGEGRWHIDDRTRSLELASDSVRLIKLGDLDGTRCRIEVDIQQPDWKGNTGIFLGYREDFTTTKELAARFQLIALERTGDASRERSPFELVRKATFLYPHSPDSTPVVGIAYGERVPWPVDGQPLRLMIDIGPRGLNRVTWGGAELGKLYRSEVNEGYTARDYQGPWGLYLHHGAVWFSRPKIERFE